MLLEGKRKALEACQKREDSASTIGESSREMLKFDHGSGSGLQIVHWTPLIVPENRKIKMQSKHGFIDASHYKNERLTRTQSAVDGGVVPSSRSPNRQFPRSSETSKSKLAKRLHSHLQDPSLWFPLYRDHLIPLIYYNVFRATITNIHILSLNSLLTSSCTPEQHQAILFPPPSTIPPTLLPTRLQRMTPHESWIDILPSGTMRDNAIKFRANYDQHDLCSDLVGCQENDTCLGQPGIIVWSDPWHPDGWEVTEKFVDKWGFLLKGCEDIMGATNRWRALRDEEPLVWELE
ncbi:hypothetical protein CSUB01_10339 [Colletotrichum sublineola]|uniref:Uncharacterized protein n=1 Tax=Colletotrichum sublineola TaxID=1173701 RepID=A0A066XPB3_COLSU|nr:hypothetical protein CSUB01_10339 [Colletotrichum sublineola]